MRLCNGEMPLGVLVCIHSHRQTGHFIYVKENVEGFLSPVLSGFVVELHLADL